MFAVSIRKGIGVNFLFHVISEVKQQYQSLHNWHHQNSTWYTVQVLASILYLDLWLC